MRRLLLGRLLVSHTLAERAFVKPTDLLREREQSRRHGHLDRLTRVLLEELLERLGLQIARVRGDNRLRDVVVVLRQLAVAPQLVSLEPERLSIRKALHVVPHVAGDRIDNVSGDVFLQQHLGKLLY